METPLLQTDPLQDATAALPAGAAAVAALPAPEPGPRPVDGIPCRPWLEHLHANLAVARRGDDPEGVHQIRVAAGRLDVWLELGGAHALRDDLRWLRRQAAAVRDLDVLLLSGPPEPFLMWLLQQYTVARRRLLEALVQPRLEGLLAAVAGLAPLPIERALAHQPGMAGKVLRRGHRALRHPQDVEAVHRLRRALRRLRYAMEWLGEKTRELKKVQEALGSFNDVAVAARLLAQCPSADQFADYPQALAQELDHRRAEALLAWQQTAPFLEDSLHSWNCS